MMFLEQRVTIDMNKPTYEEFLKTVADHRITILLDTGLYRHIRCEQPGTRNHYFDLVTWPGSLAYTGDVGSFMFSRSSDMFAFFRPDGEGTRINPQYWGEKLQAVDKNEGHLEYSREKLIYMCQEHMGELVDSMTEDKWSKVNQAIEAEVTYADNLDDAHTLLREFKVDGKQFFHDTWEWKLKDHTARYIWACYAIVHAIGMYDAIKPSQDV